MNAEILVFDGFDDLDVFGPLEVLATGGFDVSLVTLHEPRPTTSDKGTVVIPAARLSDAPEILVVPGGGWLSRAEAGAWAEVQRGELPAALARVAAAGSVVASVCTGAMLLQAAGLLEGRRAVTNKHALDELAATGVTVLREARVVDAGPVVTSGGPGAGLDMALWLVERVAGAERARETASAMEYTVQGSAVLTAQP